MRLHRIRTVLLIAGGLALCAWLLLPPIEGLLWEYRIRRAVKVDFDYPNCVPGHESWSKSRCQCELVFDRVEASSEVAFDGPDLHFKYDPQHRTYHVHGAGLVRSGSNWAKITTAAVVVNGTELPADRSSSFHVLIQKDGSLQNSRRDIAWP